jgi:hypothetical protein
MENRHEACRGKEPEIVEGAAGRLCLEMASVVKRPECVLCGEAGEGTKVWCGSGEWQGPAHEACLRAWSDFVKGRIDLEQAKKAAEGAWQKIARRMIEGQV